MDIHPELVWHNTQVFSVTLLRLYNAETITEHIQKEPPPLVICDGVLHPIKLM